PPSTSPHAMRRSDLRTGMEIGIRMGAPGVSQRLDGIRKKTRARGQAPARTGVFFQGSTGCRRPPDSAGESEGDAIGLGAASCTAQLVEQVANAVCDVV